MLKMDGSIAEVAAVSASCATELCSAIAAVVLSMHFSDADRFLNASPRMFLNESSEPQLMLVLLILSQ